ncbi:MAG: hypothetical protein Q9221_005881 [Calogaya cf. arnoldii]
MPFPYQASATPVRTRKPLREREKDREKDRERDRDRDKDPRSTPSGSSRKHREASRSSNRSPVPSSSRPASLYTQTNVTLDQLPSLPRSETASPSSTRSPTFGTSTVPSQSSHSLSLSSHFSIPASLQPYLETDDDGDFDDAKTPQASSTAHVKPYFDASLVQLPSRPTSTEKQSPPSTQKQSPPSTQKPPPSPAPSTFSAAKAPSPQNPPTPPIALSRVNTRSSDPTPSLHHPTPSLHHPRPYPIPVASPTFSPTQPFFGAAPGEQYFPHPQQAPPYYSTAQTPGHPMDMQAMPPQNYYHPYASPPQAPPQPFTQAARNQLAREQSSGSSRMSFSGDPFQTMGQMPRLPPEQALLPDHYGANAVEGEDDAVLKRIQNAIPDLSLLLTRYRQTSGQLGERDIILRQTEAEKTRVLEQKDVDIQRLTRDMHDAFQKNADESRRHGEEKDKLRLEIGNMTEKHHELQESLQAERKAREQHRITDEQLRVEHTRVLEEKAAMMREHEEWIAKQLKESAAKDENMAMKDRQHTDHQQRQARELEERLKALTIELSQKHAREITELTQKHAKEKEKSELASSLRNREMEDISFRLERDLNYTRDAHKKTLDDHLRQHDQEREAWNHERETLLQEWDNERAKMGQGSEELLSQHHKETKELQERLRSSEARLTAEIEYLNANWKADKDSFKATAASMKSTVAQLNTENSKLQKFADALEQVTDLRGRGDAFYHEAFDTLQQQISGVARDFCEVCSPEIPSQVARCLPPNLPPFLVDTPASAPVRITYVQSLISNIINRRIFQPFLFTYAELDSHFNEWGECLRNKSTKREAIWRQRTLHAAFSCASSKLKINTFAASVVDEVIAAIKPFAGRNKRDQLKAAVRKIIKTAAETWRFARIELPRILACPASDAGEGHEGEVLLSVFPRIERMALPRDLRLDGDDDDRGCVYTEGQTICSNSPAIIARRAELGEDVEMPVSVQEGYNDERADIASMGSRTNSMTSQANHSKPRTTSPLEPLTRTRSTRREAVNPFDSKPDHDHQHHDRSNRWNLDAQDGSSNRHHSLTNSHKERHNEAAGDPKRMTATSDIASSHPTGSSPTQSPAPSRAATPQLSRRTTADTTSSAGEEEAQKAKAGVPDWGDAGGNVKVPGAFGERGGW